MILLFSLIMTLMIVNAQIPVESTNQFIVMGLSINPK